MAFLARDLVQLLLRSTHRPVQLFELRVLVNSALTVLPQASNVQQLARSLINLVADAGEVDVLPSIQVLITRSMSVNG